MHCQCGTNNRAPRWTFTDPCKPEVRPGAREESASPAWLAAPVMNPIDTTKGKYEHFLLGLIPGVTLKIDSHCKKNPPGHFSTEICWKITPSDRWKLTRPLKSDAKRCQFSTRGALWVDFQRWNLTPYILIFFSYRYYKATNGEMTYL